MLLSKLPRLKPTAEDYLRAVGYAGFATWATLFILFPPTAFVSTLDFWTRLFWMGVTFIGSVGAFTGAILRVDLKLEFPSLLFVSLGPFFYSLSQLYYVLNPLITDGPFTRVALVVYGILPFVLLLPRMVSLWFEVKRQKRVNSL